MQSVLADQYVFVDESSTHLGFTPVYARAPKGERAIGSVPRNRGQNITLIAALSSTEFTADFTFEGSLDAVALEVYVEQVLIPSLGTGKTIIWDRLSSHLNAVVVGLLEAAGHRVVSLPAYSPDLNPIEEAFSKLKAFLRVAEARSREALDLAIAGVRGLISASDVLGWFGHAGYRLSRQPL
jgi:transposase